MKWDFAQWLQWHRKKVKGVGIMQAFGLQDRKRQARATGELEVGHGGGITRAPKRRKQLEPTLTQKEETRRMVGSKRAQSPNASARTTKRRSTNEEGSGNVVLGIG